jgi:hypothetical protein
MSGSPLEALRQTPKRFRFGAAVRLLWLAARTPDAGEAIRFTASARERRHGSSPG